MKTPELKIIIGATPSDCNIYIDDEQIGIIQNIKVELNVADLFPKIEITFPDLFDEKHSTLEDLTKKLACTIEKLKDIPNVTVKLKELN